MAGRKTRAGRMASSRRIPPEIINNPSQNEEISRKHKHIHRVTTTQTGLFSVEENFPPLYGPLLAVAS